MSSGTAKVYSFQLVLEFVLERTLFRLLFLTLLRENLSLTIKWHVSDYISSQYCTYTLLEEGSKSIVASATVDKREAQRKSPNMEKIGLQRCMQQLDHLGLSIGEITTDAHPQITAYLKSELITF